MAQKKNKGKGPRAVRAWGMVDARKFDGTPHRNGGYILSAHTVRQCLGTPYAWNDVIRFLIVPLVKKPKKHPAPKPRRSRCPPGPDRARIRSTTFPGIAEAMAEQWGSLA